VTFDQLAVWTDIAIVLLVAEAFVIGLPLLILTTLVVRALQRFQYRVGVFLRSAQTHLFAVRDATSELSALVLVPILVISSVLAVLSALARVFTAVRQSTKVTDV